MGLSLENILGTLDLPSSQVGFVGQFSLKALSASLFPSSPALILPLGCCSNLSYCRVSLSSRGMVPETSGAWGNVMQLRHAVFLSHLKELDLIYSF